METHRYYNRQGNPISLDEYLELKANKEYCRIGSTEGTTAFGKVLISTVWLGYDHNFGEDELAIFETMIFGGNLDGLTMRYATEEEALEGHKETVSMAQNY